MKKNWQRGPGAGLKIKSVAALIPWKKFHICTIKINRSTQRISGCVLRFCCSDWRSQKISKVTPTKYLDGKRIRHCRYSLQRRRGSRRTDTRRNGRSVPEISHAKKTNSVTNRATPFQVIKLSCKSRLGASSLWRGCSKGSLCYFTVLAVPAPPAQNLKKCRCTAGRWSAQPSALFMYSPA